MARCCGTGSGEVDALEKSDGVAEVEDKRDDVAEAYGETAGDGELELPATGPAAKTHWLLPAM